MKLKHLFTDDRAVSPVVGVALLIAITVILAAVIGGVVLGLGTGGVDTPQAQLQAQLDSDSNETVVVHNGGEPLPAESIVIETDGNEIYLSDDLEAGASVDLTTADGIDDTRGDGELTEYNGGDVTVLWEDPNSDSTTVLEQFEE